MTNPTESNKETMNAMRRYEGCLKNHANTCFSRALCAPHVPKSKCVLMKSLYTIGENLVLIRPIIFIL